MTTADALKRCTACREPKEAWRFHPDNGSPDGLAEHCKVCVNTGKVPRRRPRAAAVKEAVRPAKASKPAPKPRKKKAATPRRSTAAKRPKPESTGKSRRNWSALEREFVEAMHPVARMQDIAAALSRCKGSTEQLAYKLGLRHGTGGRKAEGLLPRAAVSEAWRRLQAGEELRIENLRLWQGLPEDHGKNSRWEAWQDEFIEDELGRRSLAEIGREIGKSKDAVRGRLRTLGNAARRVQYCEKKLARKVGVDRSVVHRLCEQGILRCYSDAMFRIVHADDAEWLIDNYWKLPTREIPKHPGQAVQQ